MFIQAKGATTDLKTPDFTRSRLRTMYKLRDRRRIIIVLVYFKKSSESGTITN